MEWFAAAFLAAVFLLRPTAPPTKVVLLPDPDGKVGALLVNTASNQLILDSANATAGLNGNGEAIKLPAEATEGQARFLPAMQSQPPRPRSFVVYFENGPAVEFVAAAGSVLKELRDYLASQPAPEITVIGHTDRVGTLQSNDVLSLNRANAVREFLQAEGISALSLEVSGRGEREPAAPTADEVPEPKNRRVEINVR